MSCTSFQSDLPILAAMRRIKHKFATLTNEKLKSFELGAHQSILLAVLAERKSSSLADLARHTSSDPAAITRAVDTLTAKGLVEKTDSSGDRRSYQLVLSPKGAAMAAKLLPMAAEVEAHITAPLSAKEKKQLAALLAKL